MEDEIRKKIIELKVSKRLEEEKNIREIKNKHLFLQLEFLLFLIAGMIACIISVHFAFVNINTCMMYMSTSIFSFALSTMTLISGLAFEQKHPEIDFEHNFNIFR